MIFNFLLFFTKSETRFWGAIVILFILGLGYLANKLTRGITTDYLNYRMNGSIKMTLMFIQGLGSIIFALLLPNNYLNKIDFIKNLYEENELWIAGTILILLFFLIIFFGTAFTLIVRQLGLKKIVDRTEIPR